MENALAQITFFAREKDSDEIDEFALFIGFPEKLSDTSARVAVKILKNGKGRKQKDIWGATEWQSITLALSLLNILLELEFQKSCPILCYRREDALKQVYPAAMADLFPPKIACRSIAYLLNSKRIREH